VASTEGGLQFEFRSTDADLDPGSHGIARRRAPDADGAVRLGVVDPGQAAPAGVGHGAPIVPARRASPRVSDLRTVTDIRQPADDIAIGTAEPGRPRSRLRRDRRPARRRRRTVAAGGQRGGHRVAEPRLDDLSDGAPCEVAISDRRHDRFGTPRRRPSCGAAQFVDRAIAPPPRRVAQLPAPASLVAA
jgi:hypothetical protein